jgi:hypothetical protein
MCAVFRGEENKQMVPLPYTNHLKSNSRLKFDIIFVRSVISLIYYFTYDPPPSHETETSMLLLPEVNFCFSQPLSKDGAKAIAAITTNFGPILGLHCGSILKSLIIRLLKSRQQIVIVILSVFSHRCNGINGGYLTYLLTELSPS